MNKLSLMVLDHQKKMVDALRGEIKQTYGALRIEDRYCAVGVIHDLDVKAGNGVWVRCSEEGEYSFIQKKITVSSMILDSFKFVHYPDKTTNYTTIKRSLIRLNDEDQLALTNIADWLEKQDLLCDGGPHHTLHLLLQGVRQGTQ